MIPKDAQHAGTRGSLGGWTTWHVPQYAGVDFTGDQARWFAEVRGGGCRAPDYAERNGGRRDRHRGGRRR